MKVIIEKTNEAEEVAPEIDAVIDKAIHGVINHFGLKQDIEISVLLNICLFIYAYYVCAYI